MSGVRLDPVRLEYELVRRGWDAADLAKAAGVSQGTLSSARQGRRINQRTLIRLAKALSTQPVVAEVEVLLEASSVGAQSSA
jgi:transcriptional regulator with XRE-family HTH domain